VGVLEVVQEPLGRPPAVIYYYCIISKRRSDSAVIILQHSEEHWFDVHVSWFQLIRMWVCSQHH